MNFIIWRIEAEALINLVAANTRIIITTIIIEGAINHRARIFDGCQIAWAKASIDFEKSAALVIGRIFFESIFNVMNIAGINVFEVGHNLSLLATKRAKQSCYRDFATTINLDIDNALSVSLKLKPCTTAWDYLCAVIIMTSNRIGLEGMGYTSILDAGSDMQFLRAATKTASGKEISAEWKCMYMTIHSCNKAIARLRKDVVGDEMYEQYICEARMIRAYCYTRLVMFFGEVPIYLDETENAECTKAQDYWDDVWKMIIDECTLCIENPVFQNNNLPGSKRPCKPSKGMAYYLRGNAYMWLAANKNPEIYAGAPGISDAEIQQYYTLAAADLGMVKECGFGLWDGPEWDGFFSYLSEHDKEMIFPLEFSFTDGFSCYWQWVIGSRSHLNSWTRLVPSTEFVNDFEMADGSKFNWTQVFPEWNSMTDAQREVFFLRDSLDTHAARVADGTAKEKDITLTAQREKAISRIGQDVYDQYYLDLGNEERLSAAYTGRDPRLEKLVVIPYKPYPMINESSGKKHSNACR